MFYRCSILRTRWKKFYAFKENNTNKTVQGRSYPPAARRPDRQTGEVRHYNPLRPRGGESVIVYVQQQYKLYNLSMLNEVLVSTPLCIS